MHQPGPQRQVLRFGVFEVDLEARELRKSGLKVKIQEQPWRILTLLLERPGEVVTREELRHELWPDGTFVDFEHGLNTAVKKLRESLSDNADTPHFVETIPRRGYRFIFIAQSDGARPITSSPQGALPLHRGQVWPVAARTLVVVLMLVAAWWWLSPLPDPKIIGSVQLTASGSIWGGADTFREVFPAILNDGSRIYFRGNQRLQYVSINGGELATMPAPANLNVPLALSRDGSRLLVREIMANRLDGPIWIVPTAGGAPSRLGDVLAHDAAWSHDQEQLALGREESLYLGDRDGKHLRKLLDTPGRPYFIRWSPDGRRLRFTLVDPHTQARSLWEVSANGTNLHRLYAGHDECCGEWAPDGRYYVFRTSNVYRSNLWLVREKSGWRRVEHHPVQLSSVPYEFRGAVPGKDGRNLFAVGMILRLETFKYDFNSHQFSRYLSGQGFIFDYSRDGKWVTYVAQDRERISLMRSRVDGSEQLELLRLDDPPIDVFYPRWSPDNKQIAFTAKLPGKPYKIFLMPAEGGTPQQLLPGDGNEIDIAWSPDGKSLIFGHPPDYMAEPYVPKAIYLVNVNTKNITKLPGSDGLFSPRWSRDGRYVAAFTLDEHSLMLFDFATRQWKRILHWPEKSIGENDFSLSGQYIYFLSRGGVFRFHIASGKLEHVLGKQDKPGPSTRGCDFLGLAEDDSALLRCGLVSSDIYALQLDLR